MIQRTISILLLITMLTTSIGLELFQTAEMLLNGEAVECVFEPSEENTKDTESKKIETKETFDKDILRAHAMSYVFVSAIEKAKLSTLNLMPTHQNHPSIQDLPPEA